MSTISCPSCGGEVPILSSASLFVVCSYCKSTLIREQDWTVFGKMATLPPEITPLQIGTKGQYENDVFELIGRVKKRWNSGYWTEWCAHTSKGETLWLADAQGQLMMSREVPYPKNTREVVNQSINNVINLLPYGAFTIDDVKRSRVVFSEGELPYRAPADQETLSIDASCDKDLFFSAEQVVGSSAITAYVGRYMSYQRFNFQNVRKLDGW